MTPGDEAGALTEAEAREDSGVDAHDDPAPAEPDPGDAGIDEDDDADDAGSVDADADADADDGEESGNSVTGEERPRTRAGLWAASVVVLVVLLVVGLVTAGHFLSRANSVNATSNGEQAAEAVARTAVNDLITADYRDPGAYSARLKSVAVGQFLNEFGNASAGFSKILAEGKVQTSGKVQDIGVEKFNGTTAQMAVLAYVTVKNTQTPQGAQRVYRLSVSMVQSGSKWLVSNVEFVQ